MSRELPMQGSVFIGRYEIVEVLGRGGFACVYRAQDLKVTRDVALKVLTPNEGDYSQLSAARFLREGKLLAGLQSPHTVTLYDFGESENGLLWMAFEFVDGQDLALTLAQQGRLQPQTVVHILEQLLLALIEAHAAGLIHRDIKPANVLVHAYAGDPWRVQLLDFGLAKPTSPDVTQLTADGRTTGTPRYMAPEQVLGVGLGPATDLYSLGLVAYELLTGEPAIDGATMKELLKEQMHGEPVRVPEQAASAELRAIVERMAARPLDDRYQTAAQVRDALRSMRWQAQGAPAADVAADSAEPTSDASLDWVAVAAVAALGFVAFIVVAALLPTEEAPGADPALRRVVQPQAAPPAPPPPAGVSTRDAAGPEPGCVADVGAPGTRVRFVRSWALSGRQVLTHVPKTFDAAEGPAVVLLMREGGDRTAEGFLRDSGFVDIAERENLVLVAPESKVDGVGRSWLTDTALTEAWRDVEAVRADWCMEDAPVFILAEGAGGRGADQLVCRNHPALRAVVVTGHRWRTKFLDHRCTPSRPVPYLNFVQLRDQSAPVNGGAGKCQGMDHTFDSVLSLDEQQQLVDGTHRCAGAPTQVPDWTYPEGTCTTRECDVPHVTCTVDAGRLWPVDERRRRLTPKQRACWGPDAKSFPYRQITWDFFDRHRDFVR